MQTIEIQTPDGVETRYVLDPSTFDAILDHIKNFPKEASDDHKLVPSVFVWKLLHPSLPKGFHFKQLVQKQRIAFTEQGHWLAFEFFNFSCLSLDCKELTPSICDALARQEELQFLYLYNYKGEPFPKELSQMQQLRELNIIGAPSSEGYTLDWSCVLAFDKLICLNLEAVNLSTIDPRLAQFEDLAGLDIPNNPISRIPEFVFDLPNLQEVSLFDTNVPLEAIKRRKNKTNGHQIFQYTDWGTF